jgi:hypothetical protein
MITLTEVEDRIVSETDSPRDDTMIRVIRVAHKNYYGLGLPRLDENGGYPADYPHTVEQLRIYVIDDSAADLIVNWAKAEIQGG